MVLYLVNILHAFLPVALVTGLILALWKYTGENGMIKNASMGILGGLCAGGVIYALSLSRLNDVDIRIYLGIINISSALLTVAALSFMSKRQGTIKAITWALSIFFIAVLSTRAAYSFILFVSDRTISVTSVLNTEAILNLSGILSGIFIAVFIIFITVRMGLTSGRGITLGILSIISALLILKLSAGVTLGLMREEIIELTSARLSFVAKVTNFSYLLTYALSAVLGVLYIISFFRRPVLDLSGPEMNSAEKRKALSIVLLEHRWLKAVITTIFVIVSTLLYYDLYASRPPKISEPVRLTADAEGLIRVKVDDVKDGKLHRFSHVTDDGHVIRFFMINLYRDRTKIGVVFDACIMCGGDKGYIQKGNEIICLACNVRIFVPSIGKDGGCNPIPLKHKLENGNIIVSVEDLETEKDYFSEVVPVEPENSVKENTGMLMAFYNEFKSTVNVLLTLGIPERETGKCHPNHISMKGRNS